MALPPLSHESAGSNRESPRTLSFKSHESDCSNLGLSPRTLSFKQRRAVETQWREKQCDDWQQKRQSPRAAPVERQRWPLTETRERHLRRAFDDIDQSRSGTVAFDAVIPPLLALGVAKETINTAKERAVAQRGRRSRMNLDALDFNGFVSVLVAAKKTGAADGIEAITDETHYPFSLIVNSSRITQLVDSIVEPVIEAVTPPVLRRRGSPSRPLATPRKARDLKLARVSHVRRGVLRTPRELATWLMRAGIDTSDWGHGAAKHVSDLLSEIETDECSVQKIDLVCLRVVGVVKMVVRRPDSPNQLLVNVRQRMADGRVRQRHVMPSEKMIDGEPPSQAALRGLREELGELLGPECGSKMHLQPDSLVSWYEMVDSPSYPGLQTQYQLNQLEVVVSGLPPTPFSTLEGDKEHYWEWWTDEEAQANGAATLRRRGSR